jgi:4a-hydroxytetrahydrobiopterin dehydratase
MSRSRHGERQRNERGQRSASEVHILPIGPLSRALSKPASFGVMADEVVYPEGWNEVRGALQRGFRFKDFAEAIAFVNRLAEAAGEADHHPDIAISWNAVTVRWWTHTKQSITSRDVEMARRTDELADAPQSARGTTP